MAIQMKLSEFFSALSIPPLIPGESVNFWPDELAQHHFASRLATVSIVRGDEGAADMIEAVAYTSGDASEEMVHAVFEILGDDLIETRALEVKTLSSDEERTERNRLAAFIREFRGFTEGLNQERVAAS